ncbi:sodium:solute symporter family protein [Mesobacillus maritimus]|uniref:sodium:solute symporter family protein n=1 Tax=Mesobacillus maritimus TaxID=1643336 RepID=UPI00203D8462|nr:sodium:solute symporter family protein [Mesobacillus maritimus]MCM3586697.1 sodium:solute symporter family protein [Mesobacillus maritimus]MCM3668549.1 sodium:solute symporter family protein [Mesobacillus maritimus]
MTVGVLIIAAFMIIPLVVGFFAASKSTKTSEDFFIQGRGMGAVAVFFTVAATWWSSFAFLGSNATFYTSGPVYLTALAWNLLFGFMYYWVGKRVWYLGKRFNYITPSDLLGDFYNNEKLRMVVAAILLIFTIPYLQIQLTGGAYLIEVASGGVIPFWFAALIFYFIIVIYVWVGGIRAVAWTDIIYGALLFFGMLFAGIYISQYLGGPTGLFKSLLENSPEHLTLPGPLGTSGYGQWFSLFIVTAIGAFMGPQIWLRMYAVKSGKLFNLMPFLLGFAAIAYMGSVLTGFSGVLLEPDVANADQILPIMLTKYAPFALASLILAAGAAAAMSTANSQIHAISTIVTLDIYQRYANPNASQDKIVKVGRISLVVFSLIAYVMALTVPGVLVTIGIAALAGTAQLIVPTIGAISWRRSHPTAAMWGLIGGVATVLLITFIPAFSAPLGFHAGVWGLLVNSILFILISLKLKRTDEKVVKRFDEARFDYNQEYHPELIDDSIETRKSI